MSAPPSPSPITFQHGAWSLHLQQFPRPLSCSLNRLQTCPRNIGFNYSPRRALLKRENPERLVGLTSYLFAPVRGSAPPRGGRRLRRLLGLSGICLSYERTDIP